MRRWAYAFFLLVLSAWTAQALEVKLVGKDGELEGYKADNIDAGPDR